MFDAMAHLDDPRIRDPGAMLERAAAAGVQGLVCAGVDPSQVPVQRWESGHTPCAVYRAFGLHPQAIDHRAVTNQLDTLAELLAREDVVALGEIGLDTRPHMPNVGLQEIVLRTQLQLASQLNLPIILHCVGAVGRLLDILSDHGPLPRGGMLHAYGGPPDLIKKFRKLGLLMSFGGKLCDPRSKKMRRAAQKVPIDSLLVESDAPDHPVNREHGQSEPAMLPAVLDALAELRGVSSETLAAQTMANARRLFGLQIGL